MINALRQKITTRPDVDAYIRSTYPVLWISGKRDGAVFLSDDATGYALTNDGTIWAPPGRIFDGADDRITFNDHPNLRMSGDITFIGWLKWSNWADTDYQTFLIKGNLDVNGVNYIFGRMSSAESRQLKFTYSDGAFRDVLDSSGWAATDGIWYCIATVVHKATFTVDFYVNGVLRSLVVDAASLNYSTNAESLAIGNGSNTGNSQQEFPGGMGQLLLYNRALTAAEIQRNYLLTNRRYK